MNDFHFELWSTEDLFYHLVDLGMIPFEEDFLDWKNRRPELLEICKITTHEYDFKKER